jgi:lipoprotein NlpI
MRSCTFALVLLAVPSWEQFTPAQSTPAELNKALADLNKQLDAHPRDADGYHERGCVHFKLGNFKESVRDFDRYLELKPERKAGHWQRGISCFYASQYEEGRKQFEGYQDFDSNDVENAVWRYMCMAKMSGTAKARREMLKVGDDRRVPMRQVYEMFKGNLTPAEVLAAARAAGSDNPGKEASRPLFYAHLYVGIYYDLEGDAASALAHLNKAAGKYRIGHYMGDVARVHRDVLLRSHPTLSPDGGDGRVKGERSKK